MSTKKLSIIEIKICCIVGLCLIVSSLVFAETFVGTPAKLISTCQADFNQDDSTDIAIYIESTKGPELIVLLANGKGYKTHTFLVDEPDLLLSCVFDEAVDAIRFDDRKEKVPVNISGIFISLRQPEGASAAYYWDGKMINEAWLSD